MTFKTDIKFDESPILRSLEREAIKRGIVTPDPVVKTAAVEETYAPSDDLHEDMFDLTLPGNSVCEVVVARRNGWVVMYLVT